MFTPGGALSEGGDRPALHPDPLAGASIARGRRRQSIAANQMRGAEGPRARLAAPSAVITARPNCRPEGDAALTGDRELKSYRGLSRTAPSCSGRASGRSRWPELPRSTRDALRPAGPAYELDAEMRSPGLVFSDFSDDLDGGWR